MIKDYIFQSVWRIGDLMNESQTHYWFVVIHHYVFCCSMHNKGHIYSMLSYKHVFIWVENDGESAFGYDHAMGARGLCGPFQDELHIQKTRSFDSQSDCVKKCYISRSQTRPLTNSRSPIYISITHIYICTSHDQQRKEAGAPTTRRWCDGKMCNCCCCIEAARDCLRKYYLPVMISGLYSIYTHIYGLSGASHCTHTFAPSHQVNSSELYWLSTTHGGLHI